MPEDNNPYAPAALPIPVEAARARPRFGRVGWIAAVSIAFLHALAHVLCFLAVLIAAGGPDDPPSALHLEAFAAVIGFPLSLGAYLITGDMAWALWLAIPNILLWAIIGGWGVALLWRRF